MSENAATLPNQATNGKQVKKLIAIAAAAIAFLFFQFVCPVPPGLERTAMSAVGILVACIILWVTEAMPFIVTVVLIFFLVPVTGIMPYTAIPATETTAAVASVFNQSSLLVPIYCLFVFAVSGAVMSTPIPFRVANLALKWAGNKPRKLIIGFSMATAVMSMFISDLAASAIFIGIGLSIVEANKGIKGQSNLAKAFTLSVAAAAAIGGVGTPIGNSLNILSMTMVNATMGINITFLSWCIICIPLALVGSFLSGWWFSRVFKLEEISQEAIDTVAEKNSHFGKLSAQEIKLIVWFVIAFGLMIASTWVPAINSMLVAFIFTVIAFVPGVDIVSKESYYKSIAWEIIMMIIGVQIIATGLVSTGVAAWFVATVLGGASAWPLIIVVFVMCVITAFLHVCIPVGPPTVSVALPLMMALAATTGVNGAIIACIGGILGGVTTILPIDSIMMICYEHGWIKMSEWVKKSWFPVVMLIVLCTVYLIPMTALMGY